MSEFGICFRSTHFPKRFLVGYISSTEKEAEDFIIRMVPECVQGEYWVEPFDPSWNEQLEKLK